MNETSRARGLLSFKNSTTCACCIYTEQSFPQCSASFACWQHTKVKMVVDAFDCSGKQDDDKGGSKRSPFLIENLWREAIMKGSCPHETLNAYLYKQLQQRRQQLQAQGKEGFGREWEKCVSESEVNFVQDRGKAMLEGRGTLLVTMSLKSDQGLRQAVDDARLAQWFQKEYSIRIVGRNLFGKGAKCLKISLETDTDQISNSTCTLILQTDAAYTTNGSCNWREISLKTSSMAADGTMLFSLSACTSDEESRAGSAWLEQDLAALNEGDLVLVRQHPSSRVGHTAATAARSSRGISNASSHSSRAIHPEHDPEVLARQHKVGVVTGKSRQAGKRTVQFVEGGKGEVNTESLGHRLWLASENACLVIECCEAGGLSSGVGGSAQNAAVSRAFARVRLGLLRPSEKFLVGTAMLAPSSADPNPGSPTDSVAGFSSETSLPSSSLLERSFILPLTQEVSPSLSSHSALLAPHSVLTSGEVGSCLSDACVHGCVYSVCGAHCPSSHQ